MTETISHSELIDMTDKFIPPPIFIRISNKPKHYETDAHALFIIVGDESQMRHCVMSADDVRKFRLQYADNLISTELRFSTDVKMTPNEYAIFIMKYAV